jgi:hypothetical protein
MANNWTWQRKLIDQHAQGIISDEEFKRRSQKQRRIGRKPTPHVCTCHHTILTAWDADTCAWLTHLDPYALTPHGEIWALTTGRTTYKLTPRGIHQRDRYNIPGNPPSTTLIVLPTHTCPETTPPQYRLTIPKKPPPTHLDPNSPPPF